VALVPSAQVRHAGSQSAPSAFRTFLLEWRDDWFDEQWAEAVTALQGRASGIVDHPCAPWRDLEVDAVEAASGQAASRMVVPLARWQAARASTQATEGAAALAAARAEVASLTAAVAALEVRLRRGRQRRRRLKRRLARVESGLAAGPARPARLRTRIARRLRA
jgi:hypothetical protein